MSSGWTPRNAARCSERQPSPGAADAWGMKWDLGSQHWSRSSAITFNSHKVYWMATRCVSDTQTNKWWSFDTGPAGWPLPKPPRVLVCCREVMMSAPKVGASNGGEGGFQSRWPCTALGGHRQNVSGQGRKSARCFVGSGGGCVWRLQHRRSPRHRWQSPKPKCGEGRSPN